MVSETSRRDVPVHHTAEHFDRQRSEHFRALASRGRKLTRIRCHFIGKLIILRLVLRSMLAF